MTVEICKEYLEIIKSMNSYDDDEEDVPMGIMEEFHYHIQTCPVCVNNVYYDQGSWQFSTDDGTKCKRCGSPPGHFCQKGCEDYSEKEIAEAKINS